MLVYKDDGYSNPERLNDIAEQFGTPCFVYSQDILIENWQAFKAAFGSYPNEICYSVKANGNLAILNTLADLGSGFDVVSQGELARVIAAQGDPTKTVFSGVGKREEEIAFALSSNIGSIHVESLEELLRIQAMAKQSDCVARIAIRVNPDVDPGTHAYISTGLKTDKFGIAIEAAAAVYETARSLSHIEPIGVACHIGSQITRLGPYNSALNSLLIFTEHLLSQGFSIQYVDIGGGFGIPYSEADKPAPTPKEYVDALLKPLKTFSKKHGLKQGIKVFIEPGRSIVASAGRLLTQVLYMKRQGDKNFAIVDAGMNDLIRPALYEAYHPIVPITSSKKLSSEPLEEYDIVGPVCESGDFLGKSRKLPSLKSQDILAVEMAGAYGFVMASNYNTRGKPPEIFIIKDQAYLTRPREPISTLYASEKILSELL